MASQNSARRESNRHLISEYLSVHPCIDCGESDIRVLEFDHVRGVKSRSVTQLAQWGYAESTIRSEIDKCVVRCCNCHRRKTLEGTARDIFEQQDPPLRPRVA